MYRSNRCDGLTLERHFEELREFWYSWNLKREKKVGMRTAGPVTPYLPIMGFMLN